MVNHPNRRQTPYIVHLAGCHLARFSHPDHAQEYAQAYSERHKTGIEVSAPSGLIGQYRNGRPTPEFACREDAWFPAGPRS